MWQKISGLILLIATCDISAQTLYYSSCDKKKSCSRCAIDDKNFLLEQKYTVDIKKSVVINTSRLLNAGPGQHIVAALEQCKIIDKNNWVCEQTSAADGFINTPVDNTPTWVSRDSADRRCYYDKNLFGTLKPRWE